MINKENIMKTKTKVIKKKRVPKNDVGYGSKKATLDENYRIKVSLLDNPYGDSTSALNIRNAIHSIDLNDKKWYTKQKLI